MHYFNDDHLATLRNIGSQEWVSDPFIVCMFSDPTINRKRYVSGFDEEREVFTAYLTTPDFSEWWIFGFLEISNFLGIIGFVNWSYELKKWTWEGFSYPSSFTLCRFSELKI